MGFYFFTNIQQIIDSARGSSHSKIGSVIKKKKKILSIHKGFGSLLPLCQDQTGSRMNHSTRPGPASRRTRSQSSLGLSLGEKTTFYSVSREP